MLSPYPTVSLTCGKKTAISNKDNWRCMFKPVEEGGKMMCCQHRPFVPNYIINSQVNPSGEACPVGLASISEDEAAITIPGLARQL